MVAYQPRWGLLVLLMSGSSSIRFDDYESDLNNLDNSKGNFCFHVGTKCLSTLECCGYATCVLPAWSSSPRCLVPGYKHDERMRGEHWDPPRREAVLFFRDLYNTTAFDYMLDDPTDSPGTSDPSDVLGQDRSAEEIGNNTNDFSGSSQNSEIGKSLEWSSNSFSSENDTVNSTLLWDDLATLKKSELEIESSKALKDILKPTFGPAFNKGVSKKRPSSSKLLSSSELSKSAYLLNRHSFLLINRTVSQNNMYDQLKNNENFSHVVRLLRERLKKLHDRESRMALKQYSNYELPSDTVVTTPKPSKWDFVRRHFLHKGQLEDEITSVVQTSDKNIPELTKKEDAHLQGMHTLSATVNPVTNGFDYFVNILNTLLGNDTSNEEKLKNLKDKRNELGFNQYDTNEIMLKIPSDTVDTPKPSNWDFVRKLLLNKGEVDDKFTTTIQTPEINKMNEFKTEHSQFKGNTLPATEKPATNQFVDVANILNTFLGIDKSNQFIEDEETMNNLLDSSNSIKNKDNVLEVFNIDVPYSSGNRVTTIKHKDTLVKTFDDILKTLESFQRVQNNDNLSVDPIENTEATIVKQVKPKTPLNIMERNTPTVRNMIKKANTSIWSKFYFWHVPQNVSSKLGLKLHKLFDSERKSEKESFVPLNEHFLMKLNSRNTSKKYVDYDSSSDEHQKTSSDYYFHYTSNFESDSSESEERNKHYLFVMHKKNCSGHHKTSRWRKILKFFHMARVISCPIDEKHGVYVPEPSSSNNETKQSAIKSGQQPLSLNYQNNSKIVTDDVIRIPENLMPEALVGREFNETEFLYYEDSGEVEERNIKTRKSNNRLG